ncbi:MAG: hypothetical protein ACKVOP_12020 [Sphingomonadaceae bacterium]
MAEDVENHTIKLLQEMRGEMRALHEKLDGVSLKVDGNTVLLNLVAGVTHDHEQRLGGLERKTP